MSCFSFRKLHLLAVMLIVIVCLQMGFWFYWFGFGWIFTPFLVCLVISLRAAYWRLLLFLEEEGCGRWVRMFYQVISIFPGRYWIFGSSTFGFFFLVVIRTTLASIWTIGIRVAIFLLVLEFLIQKIRHVSRRLQDGKIMRIICPSPNKPLPVADWPISSKMSAQYRGK